MCARGHARSVPAGTVRLPDCAHHRRMTRFLSARSRGRVVVGVLAAVMAVPVMARAGSAAADDRPLPDADVWDHGCFAVRRRRCWGRLDRGLTKATPEQVKSLRKLEADAVADVIKLHGLSASDTNAVLTWGRSEAQAQLFTRLLNALDEDEDRPVRRPAERGGLVDGDDATQGGRGGGRCGPRVRHVGRTGPEPVRALLSANASESELREFLDDPPQNYNNPDHGRGDERLLQVPVTRPVRFGVHGLQRPDLFRPMRQHPRLQPADTELRPVREVGRVGGELLAAEQRAVRRGRSPRSAG